MTRAAEALIYEKVRRGEIITPIDHITTIDTPEELDGFVFSMKANGRWTDETNTAVLRRRKQIGENA